MTPKTTGIVLATMVMDEVETYGSERWSSCGGQSHAWDLLEWVIRRYDIREFTSDIIHGFLRADLYHFRNVRRAKR